MLRNIVASFTVITESMLYGLCTKVFQVLRVITSLIKYARCIAIYSSIFMITGEKIQSFT